LNVELWIAIDPTTANQSKIQNSTFSYI